MKHPKTMDTLREKRTYKTPHSDPRIIPLHLLSPCIKDISGETFARLTALGAVQKPESSHYKRAYWLFSCSCGGEKIIPSALVTPPRKGVCKPSRVKSCGCLLKELQDSWKTSTKRQKKTAPIKEKTQPITIEIDGCTRTVSEWAKISRITPSIIFSRIRRGMSGKALIIPTKKNKGGKVIKGEG